MSRSLSVALAAGLVLGLGPLPARARGLLDFVDDLHVSGHGQLMLQRQDVSGGGSSAYYGQYWNTGAIESSASVHVEGPLFVPGLSLRCDVTRTGNFGINETRWALTQQIGDAAVTYGDINVRLTGSEFASFYKQIRGTQFEYSIDPSTFLMGFYASEKGAVYRETIAGENTAGPYFLRAAPIVDGSERVKVDEQVMQFGVDYVLHYETGQLYFETWQNPPRIIPSTSVISVSYQSLRGAGGGELMGMRAVRELGGARGGGKNGVQELTLAGSGTAGPYSLKGAPIADGSEEVRVDEQVMQFGVDYVVDYETGKLYFETDENPSRIIPNTSAITVRYRSRPRPRLGVGGLPGLQRFGERGGGTGHIGLSLIEQRAGTGATSRDTAAWRRDVYYGSGTTGPFETTYRPIMQDGTTAIINGQETLIDDALIVTVDSSENIQQEGVDYRADYSRGIIEFFRIVPPTSTVYIKYYYDPRTEAAPLGSSRRVLGVDISYPLSNKISLESEFALGGQLDGDQGMALRAGARANFDRFDIMAEYRQVDPKFTYINSVGFQRNEKGLNFRAGYRPRKYVRTDFQLSDLRTSQGYSFGSSPYGYGGFGGGVGNFSHTLGAGLRQDTDEEDVPSLDTRAQRTGLGLELTFPRWPSLRISRDSMSNSGGSGGDNEYQNLNLDLTYAPEGKSYQVSASHSIGTQRYEATSTTGDGDDGTTARLGTDTTNTRLGATWRPLKTLDLSASFNTNQTDDQSTSGRTTEGQMLQANARWRATDKLNVTLSHLITKSTGSLFGSFFPGGSFGGYGGGGPRSVRPGGAWEAWSRQTDGDGDGDGEPEESRYVDKGTRVDFDYRPWDRLSLNAGFSTRSYQSGGTVG
ncbi:MAG: hypothetical protein PVH68_21175, partial [Armatimonadota bacterium]